MNIDKLKKLAQAGVQFGHETWRCNPKMHVYIWGQKNGVHLIDLAKTEYQLQSAVKFLENVAAHGKLILWVGTKRSAQEVVSRVARETLSPSVTHRWIGGTLTNYSQVKKSITKLMHFEDVVAKSSEYSYTKKEMGMVQKAADRLKKNVGGLLNLTWPIGALVVVDIRKEHVAVKEAIAARVPVVALVDTNCDPSFIDYVIPGNDDAPRSIAMILDELEAAVKKGQAVAAERPQEELLEQENLVERLVAEVERSEGAGNTKPGGAGAAKKRPAKPMRRRTGPARGPSK